MTPLTLDTLGSFLTACMAHMTGVQRYLPLLCRSDLSEQAVTVTALNTTICLDLAKW